MAGAGVSALTQQRAWRRCGVVGEKCLVSTTEEEGVPVGMARGCVQGHGAEVH